MLVVKGPMAGPLTRAGRRGTYRVGFGGSPRMRGAVEAQVVQLRAYLSPACARPRHPADTSSSQPEAIPTVK